MPGIVGQPQFQRWGQSFAAEVFGAVPDPFDDFLHWFIPWFGPGPWLGCWQLPPDLQQLDGILALIAILFAKLIQKMALALFASAGVSPPDSFQLLISLTHSLHVHRFLLGVFFP